MSNGDIIIGIDGGGTHTRVMISDLEGRVLAYATNGAASIHKDIHAERNVKEAISEALLRANKKPQQVAGLAAGIAGCESEKDLEWVEKLTAVEGLTCPRWHVNDAVAAHWGAFAGAPGIVVISGTGSLIFAITDNGVHLRNYDYHHYANSAARFIAYDAVYEVLAGNIDETDDGLIQAMLQHWGADSMNSLKQIARSGFHPDYYERNRILGQFAPNVTEWALKGSSIAAGACNRAIREIKVGIEMLGDAFVTERVSVVFIGSVVNSDYFTRELQNQLMHGNNKHYSIITPQLEPAAGAVLYARNRMKLDITESIIHNLRKFKR